MTWAHILSLSRVAATIPVALLIAGGSSRELMTAAVVFTLASLTDLLDGPLARRGQTVGPFGIYLDTTGDKVLVSVVLISMATAGLTDQWVAMLIVGREFLVTGVRTLGAVDGYVISANFAGKVKTTVTLFAIIYILVIGAARAGIFGHRGSLAILWGFGWWLMLLAVMLTVYSGLKYILDARPLFQQSLRRTDGSLADNQAR